MSSLELKIPPDVVWLATALLMWLTSRVTPDLVFPDAVRRVLGLSMIAAGAILIVAARLALQAAATTWRPTEPGRTSTLVTSGVYRFSRNPIYLGMAIVLLSWAVVLASPAAVLVSALFVAYVDRFQIQPEEMILTVAFGQNYLDYIRCVRRWM
jgi:protein-S-isoprenylcysteine O-methyltransferase Ste14